VIGIKHCLTLYESSEGKRERREGAWDATLARITCGEGTAEIIARVVFMLRCWICKQKEKVGIFGKGLNRRGRRVAGQPSRATINGHMHIVSIF
jgi:hypothetical protein